MKLIAFFAFAVATVSAVQVQVSHNIRCEGLFGPITTCGAYTLVNFQDDMLSAIIEYDNDSDGQEVVFHENADCSDTIGWSIKVVQSNPCLAFPTGFIPKCVTIQGGSC